ncbi:dimethylarginine dimethylaminohydrolase family protein [Desulfurobacterium sp.]
MMEVKVSSCAERLHSCVMAYPCHFDITVPINEKQKQNKGQISKELAVRQYNAFVNLLQRLNVKTYFLDLVPECSYQVFTRDIGFVIDGILFVSRMSKSVREKEVNALKEFLKQCRMESGIHQLISNAEGGDVFVLKDFVLIGVSSRTTESAVEEIRNVLNKKGIKKEVIVLHFNVSKLHLDCVLGVVNEETAVITPFLKKESIETLTSLFGNLIEIDADTANMLGTNFVSIDGKTVVVTNKKVGKILKECGFQPIYVDYSEFIKAGGSVRCSILPLLRL